MPAVLAVNRSVWFKASGSTYHDVTNVPSVSSSIAVTVVRDGPGIACVSSRLVWYASTTSSDVP